MKKAIPGFILSGIFIVLIVLTIVSIKSDFTRSSTRAFHYEANGVTYDGIIEVSKPLNERQWKKIENEMIENKIISAKGLSKMEEKDVEATND